MSLYKTKRTYFEEIKPLKTLETSVASVKLKAFKHALSDPYWDVIVGTGYYYSFNRCHLNEIIKFYTELRNNLK